VNHEGKVLAKAHHPFQQANTGDVSEYTMLDKKFVDGFLEAISHGSVKN
jgi:hypothetical protein